MCFLSFSLVRSLYHHLLFCQFFPHNQIFTGIIAANFIMSVIIIIDIIFFIFPRPSSNSRPNSVADNFGNATCTVLLLKNCATLSINIFVRVSSRSAALRGNICSKSDSVKVDVLIGVSLLRVIRRPSLMFTASKRLTLSMKAIAFFFRHDTKPNSAF